MSATLESAEFDIDTGEASVHRATERIRAGIGQTGFTRLIWKQQAEPERRSESRLPLITGAFLMAVHLEDSRAVQTDPDEPLVPVITLNMSPGGVGIQHDEPVPDKTCLLIFDLWAENPVTLLVNHRWFRQDHDTAFRYRSGFAILGVARQRQAPHAAG